MAMLPLPLLGNSIATGAGLYVLISLLGPISGAHFNPIVSLMLHLSGHIERALCVRYVIAQIIGGIVGVWVTPTMPPIILCDIPYLTMPHHESAVN